VNAAELIRTVREDYLDDVSDSPDQADEDYDWKSPFLLRAFAEAERIACSGSDLLFDDSTPAVTQITLATDTASYTLSSKITRIEEVIYDGVPLVQKTERELLDESGDEWRTETGAPENFIVKGRKIRFFPVPTSTQGGETVYMEVYRLPLKSFTDQPEIPEEHHEHLCYFVAYRAYSRRDEDTYEPKKAAEMLAMFESIFGRPTDAETRAHLLEQPRNTNFGLNSLVR